MNYFFAVPWRGSFGRILTMQLEPPKTHALLSPDPETLPKGEGVPPSHR